MTTIKNKIASFFNALFVNSYHFRVTRALERAIDAMRPAERFAFTIVAGIMIVTGIALILQVHNLFLVEVPSFGGSFREGLVGTPRFINPVLALSETDKDISSLVYAGLVRQDIDSAFQSDLAEFSISEDGTVYDFRIKDSAFFHDGEPVTSDDVLFTIEKTRDPIIKSPRRANWEGVRVEKVNDKEVRFILEKPYAPFLHVATIGILPKHIWGSASSEEFPFSQFNVDPIGAGPYRIENVDRNSAGIPTSLTLEAWKGYILGRPKIKNISFKFFQNEVDLLKAYNAREIDSIAGLSQEASRNMLQKGVTAEIESLPRIFAVFLNQNVSPLFLNKEVRLALDTATPKETIVENVLLGLGRVLDGPTPFESRAVASERPSDIEHIEEAKTILLDAGWKPDENGILQKKVKSETQKLQFSIATPDTPELKATAEALKTAWEALGATVEVRVFESGDLSQNVLRPRKYDALLFGEVITEESDLYPFWHSSQRNDPGLNISLYTNITADKLLEEMRTEQNPDKLEEKRKLLVTEIQNDAPAIFLFVPNFVYIPAKNIKNISLKDVSSSDERFITIHDWFIETDKVWKFFAPH